MTFRRFFLFVFFIVSFGVAVAGDKAADAVPQIQYVKLSPDIVTNLNYKARPAFILLRLELMVESKEAATLIVKLKPMLRAQIIKQLNKERMVPLMTRKGRIALRDRLLKLVQDALQSQVGKPLVKQVLFTRIVVE